VTTSTDSDPPEEPQTPERRLSKLEKRMTLLEATIGEAADPIAKTPASGLVGAVVGVQAALEKLTDELKAEKDAREQRRIFWTRIGWGVGLPVGVSSLLGAGALVMRWILTLHH
jgi:uncharacterized coiled-coil protein SlyX